MRSTRPVFLNLTQIRMPVGALTSIGHRITGMLLAAGVPVGVFLLDRSLQDEQGFADVCRRPECAEPGQRESERDRKKKDKEDLP